MTTSTGVDSLGRRIKRRRTSANFTQRQLAHRIGVDLGTVSRWERDISPPDVIHCRLLAAALGGEPFDYAA
jgi:transcriptional regulator with XRE-family HTH domain